MKLLLISKREEDKAFTLEVASQLSLEWENRERISDIGPDAPDSEVFVDVNAFASPEEFKSQLQQIPEPAGIHLIAGADTLDMPSYFGGDPIVKNIVLRRFDSEWKAARHYAETIAQAKSGGARGLAMFRFKKEEIHQFQINEPIQRRFAVRAIIEQLTELNCQERMATHIAAAVDEILMNGLMDAPLGRSASPEEVRLALEGNPSSQISPVDFEVGANHDFFGFGVTDQCGTLDPRRAMQFLCKAFGSDSDIRKLGVGAGLGLALAFRSGASLVFSCEPRMKTEVFAFFLRTQSVKEFKRQFQFVSFI